MLKGIIFDFDYTLTDRSYALYLGAQNIVRTHLKDLNLMEQEAIIQRIMTLDEFGTIDKDHIIKNLIKNYPFDYDELKVDFAKLSYYMAPFTKLDQETIPLLKYLKENTGFKLAILTNGNTETQMMKINQVGITSYFDYIAVAEESGYWKPDPRAFTYIANKLGLKPSECLYIGDCFYNDIIGAYRANMQYLLLNNDRKHTYGDFVPVIDHLMDLLKYLEI